MLLHYIPLYNRFVYVLSPLNFKVYLIITMPLIVRGKVNTFLHMEIHSLSHANQLICY